MSRLCCATREIGAEECLRLAFARGIARQYPAVQWTDREIAALLLSLAGPQSEAYETVEKLSNLVSDTPERQGALLGGLLTRSISDLASVIVSRSEDETCNQLQVEDVVPSDWKLTLCLAPRQADHAEGGDAS